MGEGGTGDIGMGILLSDGARYLASFAFTKIFI